jgi:hypothetical protein
MSNHALPTLGVDEKIVSAATAQGQSYGMQMRQPNLHYLRGAKVYLFEIDTVTGAKRPEPRDLNSKAKALSAEALG